MARVKGWSLATLTSLGKAVTYSYWKGILVVKKHMPKLGTDRAPKVKRNNDRFRVCMRALEAIDVSVSHLFRWWAEGSDFTWRDQFISQYMSMWNTYNQAPIVVTSIDSLLVGETLQYCATFGNYFALKGEGYGTLAWGASPYGHAEKYYAPYGWPVNRETIQRWSPVPAARTRIVPRDKPAWRESPENLTTPAPTCKKPFILDGDIVPEDYEPDDLIIPLSLNDGPQYGVTGKHLNNANCPGSAIAAWYQYNNDPIISAGAGSYCRLWTWANPTPPGKNVGLYNQRGTAVWNWPAWVTQDTWPWFTGLEITITWEHAAKFLPWYPTFDFHGYTVAIGNGTKAYEFRFPETFSVGELFFQAAGGPPPFGCPGPAQELESVIHEKTAYATYYPFFRSACITFDTLGRYPFITWADRAEENPPILCPPLLVTEEGGTF